jgi:hypothetical protein
MDDIPELSIHPSCGFTVDESFECPLVGEGRFTIAATYESATKGCPQCIMQYMAIREIAHEEPHSTEIQGSHNSVFLSFLLQGQYFVFAWADNDDSKDIKRPPYDEDESPLCKFYGQITGGLEYIERGVPCDTRSTQSLATVQKWIDNCDKGHDCMQILNPKLPRRVLDVRNDRIKLHETTSTDDGSRYACLSHCWGALELSSPLLCTTLSTVKDLYEDVPWTQLPLTYQDAITFTRQLDISFLWIDSLCIIQDGPNKLDWHEQSAKMADIYQNAYITFAAAASSNPQKGCYTREDMPCEHPVGRPIAIMKYSDGIERDIFVRRNFTHDEHLLPLLRRGWVYQERTLSPRVLYFVGEELIWECNHIIDCECGAESLENKFERIRISNMSEDSVVGPNRQHGMPLALWYQIVSEYTMLKLSKQSDMLPALSGIVKVFAEKIKDQYVAGLWKRTLIPNLLWYSAEEQQGGKADSEAQQWRAPSWSWASRDWASRAHFLPVTKEFAKFKNIVCQPSGADPTGELERTAHFTLVTKTVPASLEYSQTDSGCFIRLGPNSIIRKAPEHTWYSLVNMDTGYIDLENSLLPKKNGSVDILLAQIANCTGRRQPYLYGHHAPIPIQQEVRSYMLLARRPNDENDGESWIRIGLATIAKYEPNMAIYGPHAETFSDEEKEEKVKLLTRIQIKKALRRRAAVNRSMFRRFDQSETQDLVVW